MSYTRAIITTLLAFGSQLAYSNDCYDRCQVKKQRDDSKTDLYRAISPTALRPQGWQNVYNLVNAQFLDCLNSCDKQQAPVRELELKDE